MKNLFKFSLLFLFTLVLQGCRNDEVALVSFNPTQEVNQFTSFELLFDKDLAPEDLLDQWVDDEFVIFEPKIPGKFKWVASNYLIFSPEIGLQLSTDYTARVTDKVLFKTPFKSNFEKIEFHTAYFDVSNVEFLWQAIPNSDYKVAPRMNVHFNYEVDPAVVKEYLSVDADGKPVSELIIENTSPSKIIAVNLGENQQKELETIYTIKTKKGLPSIQTKTGLKAEKEFRKSLPPLQKLQVMGVSSGFDGKTGWIEIITSQEVRDKELKKYITLDSKTKTAITKSGNVIRITGTFTPGTMTELVVNKGISGLFGGKLDNEYRRTITMADLDPELKFTDRRGKYLMRSGMKNVQATAVNVPEVELEIHEVFANNLIFFLNQNGNNYYDDYYYDDYYYDDYYGDYGNGISNYGKQIHAEKITIGELHNSQNNFMVNLEGQLKTRFKGVFVAKIMDAENRWRKDSKIISLSDIGIISKRSANSMAIFVNSIETTDPMAGVEITVISSNNQPLAKGVTDETGTVTFTNLQELCDGFVPRLITATQGDEFNFIDLNETLISTSRFELGGKHEYHIDYETYMYSDRNLYRPGETVHLSAIVRDKKLNIVKDQPVIMNVLTPRGKKYRTFKLTLNAQGSFEQDVELPDAAQTGEYVAEVFTGSNVLITSYRFSVEEFVPNKIRVKVDQDLKKLDLKDKMEVSVQGEYLFGAPTADHSGEIDIRLDHRTYHSKKYPDFNFGWSNIRNDSRRNELHSFTLDAEGKTSFTYQAPTQVESSGYLSGTAYASVFDLTGRTVTAPVFFQVYPTNYFLGIKVDRYYFSNREKLTFDFVAVDREDKELKNFPVEVEIIRHSWRSVLKKNNHGRYRYVSEKKTETVLEKKEVVISGGAYTFEKSIEKSGNYEVRLYKKGEDKYVKRTFYVYGYYATNNNSFEVDKEGRVEIKMDKDKYEMGETAKVLFTTPFSGKMLVTIEREDIMEHRYLNVVNNAAEMELRLEDRFVPNAFITATLFKPHNTESTSPFLVGHGFASIEVQNKNSKLDVEIIAPDKVKPNTTPEIVIKTTPQKDIYVTFALVDEGILQIKGYKSPDPHAYMYGKRSLKVKSYDLYKLLLPEMESLSSPAGGDESEAAKRINPMKSNRFKLLAEWSGIRKTNSKGEVRINIPLPQYNGEARLMAVAYEGSRFGSASKPMKISDDVVMMPAIPRVLSAGDSIQLPVSLLNTTDKSGTMKMKLTVEGPLSITSSTTQSVKLDPNGTKTAYFGVAADNVPGVGKFILEGTGLDNVKQQVEISIRPISPYHVQEGSGTIKAGQKVNIPIPQDYVKGTQGTSLMISKFPGVQLASHLRYLVGYPHGCVEQTTSKAFPQLYVSELAAAVSKLDVLKGPGRRNRYDRRSPEFFINEAIRKLQGMLLPNGGFSYWPGQSHYHYWGSVYASHFLIEAKNAGYVVSDYVIDQLTMFLARKSTVKSTYKYSIWKGGKYVEQPKAQRDVIYALYVLAMVGKGDLSIMNYYRSRPELLMPETRYLLAGAYGLMNQWKAFNDLLPTTFEAVQADRMSGGSFRSTIQANAIMLNVLLEVDPTNSQIPGLIKYLSQNASLAWSTNDRSWLFLAMGKAATKNAATKMTVEVKAGGKSLTQYTEGTLSYKSDEMNAKTVTLEGEGTGELYYFWSTTGVKDGPQNFVPDVDKNLKVRRQFMSRTGQVISGNEFQQGDLIVCHVTLNTNYRNVQNVAISDLIPAGFEIENPRLSTSTSLSWMKNSSVPEYIDFRDDRALIFTSLYNTNAVHYYYMLRAVNAGKFVLPPIGAEAMYDPEYHSYHGGKIIQIVPKASGG